MGYRIVSDEGRAVIVERDDGQRIRVAKQGMQKFNEGGGVSVAPNARTDESLWSQPPQSVPIFDPMASPLPPEPKPFDLIDAAGGALGKVSDFVTDSSPYKRFALKGADGTPFDALSSKPASGPVAPPPVDAPATPQTLPQPAPAPVAAPAAPSVAAAPAAPRPAGAGIAIPRREDTSGLDAQQVAAARQAGEIEARSQQAQADLVARANADKEALAADYKARIAESQARADKMRSEIASGKEDPSRWWGSRSTGQKASAWVGMILGGIGQSLGGGSNPVIAMMDKAVDQDLDIQRRDLGKKQSLLDQYIKEGHDLRSAQQLAKADLMDALAGQIQAASLRSGSDKARLAGEQAALSLQQSAAQRRAAEHQQTFANRLAVGEYALKQEQVAAQRQAAAATLAAKTGVDSEQVTYNDAGQPLVATSKDAKTKLEASLLAKRKLDGLLDQYEALLKSSRNLPGVNVTEKSKQARGLAEGLHQQLMLAAKEANALGTLDNGSVKFLEQMIPGPGTLRVTDADLGKLRSVRQASDNAASAALKTYTRPTR
jgi:hypothetical protein